MKRCVAVRPIVPIAIMAVLCLTLGTGTPARAGAPFDGSQAGGATFGAGLVTGMICWTIELGTQDRYHTEEETEQRDDDYERTGWYGQVSGAYVHEFIDEGKEEEALQEAFGSTVIDYAIDSPHSGGFRVAFGRRCHERIAVELDVEWIAPFDSTLESSVGKIRDTKIEAAAGTVNIKGYLLTGRIQPYLLGGVGTLSIETDSKNATDSKGGRKRTGQLALRGGGGVDFYLDRNWVLNVGVDYLYSATNLDYVDFLTVSTGVQYRF